MALHLNVVCDDQDVFAPERTGKVVRMLGEILPFILAKYGVETATPGPDEDQHWLPERRSSRFTDEDLSSEF